MTIASLIVSRKDEWNHISKEFSHLQYWNCIILRFSWRGGELGHWAHRASWTLGRGQAANQRGRQVPRKQAQNTWLWSQILSHNPGHRMRLLTGGFGGRWSRQTSDFVNFSVFLPPPPLMAYTSVSFLTSESSGPICEMGLIIPVSLCYAEDWMGWQI